jgi:hypothetical protein
MPFSLRNSPSTFQRLMTKITAGMQNRVTFIDDLCLYNDTWESHYENIKEILTRLKKLD